MNSIRHSVVTRLLTVFIACAVVPIVLFASLSIRTVDERIEEETGKRLRQTAEAVALGSLDRLAVAEHVLRDALRGRTSNPEIWDRYFDGIVVGDASGTRSYGEAFDIGDALSAELIGGPTGRRLVPVPERDGFAIVVSDARSNTGGRRIGLVNMQRVFFDPATPLLPVEARVCLADRGREFASCSPETDGAMRSAVLDQLPGTLSGTAPIEFGAEVQLAGFYQLHLKPSHGYANWTVSVMVPRTMALAPIAAFGWRSAASATLTVLGASFLVLVYLRRQLAPLDQLLAATRRITDHEFAVQLEVRSGDEFEQVARGFERMSSELAAHFDALGLMLDIDREILSTLDPGSIARTIASRIGEVYRCDASAVLLAELEGFDGPALFLCAADRTRVVRAEGSIGWIRELAEGEHPLPMPTAAEPSLSQLLDECPAVRVVPLVYGDERVGVLAVGVANANDWPTRGWSYVRQLADQGGVSLATAAVMKRNERLANYDQLTGLPNRLLLGQLVAKDLEKAARTLGRGGAIYVIDVDDFKRVNDTLGHHAGDQLLCAIAGRLTKALPTGVVARLGGDEFACYAPGMADSDDAGRIAKAISSALREPLQLRGNEILTSGSVGIAIWPSDGESLDELLKNADTAMYSAKANGKNGARFYTRALNEHMEERLRIETGLRRALEEDDLELHYQPIVDIATREVIGAEALIRWRQADGRMVSPASFIPVAEETGMIVEIGEWILETACKEASRWAQIVPELVYVSVNVAARQFSKPGLVGLVRQALTKTGLAPDRLIVELTESTLMSPDQVVKVLSELRAMGIRISVDDFGTGYSSLAYLKQFPLDYLKLDQSFTRGVINDPDDAAIAEAILGLSDSLGLGVIAEGVETEHQLAFLSERGCRAAQGYLFSKAVPGEQFRKLLID